MARAACKRELDLAKLRNAGILEKIACGELDKCRLNLAASDENLDNSHAEAVNGAAPPPFDEGGRAR